MTARDIFGLVLRISGLWMLGLASLRLWAWFAMQGWFLGTVGLLVFVALGAYLLVGAPAVMRLSYPDDPHRA